MNISTKQLIEVLENHLEILVVISENEVETVVDNYTLQDDTLTIESGGEIFEYGVDEKGIENVLFYQQLTLNQLQKIVNESKS